MRSGGNIHCACALFGYSPNFFPMNRKLFTVVLLALLGALGLSAQNNGPVWGLKASIGIELPGYWRGNGNSTRMFTTGTDVTAGTVCNVSLGSGFFLEPGLSVFYQSYKYDDLTITSSDGTSEQFNPSLYKFGFQVPVLAGYSIPAGERMSMNVYTGPQLRVSAAGKVRLNEQAIHNAGDFNLWDSQRRFEAGWVIGAGCQVDRIMIGLEGTVGMNNILKHQHLSYRQNRLSLSLTYYL